MFFVVFGPGEHKFRNTDLTATVSSHLINYTFVCFIGCFPLIPALNLEVLELLADLSVVLHILLDHIHKNLICLMKMQHASQISRQLLAFLSFWENWEFFIAFPKFQAIDRLSNLVYL